MRFLKTSMWSFIFCWNKGPNRNGAASVKVSLSLMRVLSSLFRHEDAFWCPSVERWADVLPMNFKVCWADSTASLEVRVPDRAN